MKFTDTSWNTVVRYAGKWRNLDGEEKKIADTFWDVFNGTKEDAEELYGYHKFCYQRFCDILRQKRAEIRIRKRKAETGTHSPNKRLRPNPSESSTSDDILPAVCIICKKDDFLVKIHGKRVKDKLLQAETTDAGSLRAAATKKHDESILKHIRGKDCEAIEVCYHRTCYKKYVTFLYKKPSDLSDSDHQLYEKSFEKFSSEIITKRIINDKEILYMSKLLAVFKSYVGRVEDLDASDYGSSMLKSRLQVKFPQLVFSHPPKRVNSEMVFVVDTEDFESSTRESTETGSFGSESVTSCATSTRDTNDSEKINCSTSEPSTSESVPFTANSTVSGEDTDQINSSSIEPSTSKSVPSGVKSTKSNPFLYTSALKLRDAFSKITVNDGARSPLSSDDCKSSVNNGTTRPLSSDDCKSSIPIPLYNTFAWMIGASDEQTLDNYVKVEDSVNLQLLPILQDIVELHSRDKGKTPQNH
ncbi:uncharacterized protein LOC126819478 isoform X2 [Patella vulgata]|nr:uncharacterized protein LOC126819478 isoform X2 [Patella vulgata]